MGISFKQDSCPAGPQIFCGAGLLALIVGFLAGLVLYLPWDSVWDMVLRREAAKRPQLGITWQNIDRAGPLGFRINGLSLESPGWIFAPRLQWMDVRIGAVPRLAVTADTGGRQLKLVYLDSGDFDLRGVANLACLGRRDIIGSVDVRATGRLSPTQDSLAKGLLDLRGKAVQLPEGLLLGEAALSLDYGPEGLLVRSFTLREPLQVRAQGTAEYRREAPLLSPYAVTGEVIRGRESLPFSSQGVLGDFLGRSALGG